MDFLIDIVSKKRKIVEKIKEGIFSFNDEEGVLIESDTDLKKIAFEKLSLGYEFWTPVAAQFFKDTVQAEDLEYLSDDVFYYACLAEIDNGHLSELEDLLSYTVRVDEVEKYFENKLKDKNYRPWGTLTNFVMNVLIKSNRYDLFSTINQYYQDLSLSSETMKLIVDNYPYEYNSLPFSVDENLISTDFEKLNVYTLFQLFHSDRQRIFPILKSKLFDPKTDLAHPFKKLFPIDEFYIMLNENEQKKFRKIVIQADLKWYINQATSEEIEENISAISDIVKQQNIIFDRPIQHEDILLQNKVFMDALLETANFLLLFRSPLIDEYIPQIITMMNQKAENYQQNFVTQRSLREFLLKYPEVFRAALRNNCVNLSTAIDFEIRGTELEKIIEEEAFQNKAAFHYSDFASEKYLEKFILSGNIRGMLMNLFGFFSVLTETENKILTAEECEKLILEIKDDLYLQDALLKRFPVLIFQNERILEFFLHSNSLMLETVIDYINHHEELEDLYTDKLYDSVKEYYALKYHLNIERLDLLEQRFGPTIIRFIDNETLAKIIGLEDSKFDKLLKLFPDASFTMASLETIYDSLKQYAFSREKTDIISIFAHIKHSIEDGNNDYEADLKELLSVMDEKFYKRFEKTYPDKVNSCKNDANAFLNQIILEMMSTNPREKEKATAMLHTITDYYIATKREEYRKSYNMIQELNLPYQIDQKDFEKQLMFYFMNLNIGIPVNKEEGKDEAIVKLVITELIKNGMDSLLAIDVVAYYLKQNFEFANDLPTIKKNVRYAIPIIRKIVKEYIEGTIEYYEKQFDGAGKVKRNYYVPSTELNMYQILTTLRIDSLEKNVLSDDPKATIIYESLVNTMEKYKLHVLPPCLKTLLDSPNVQISSDLTNISGFISYYHQVYENEKRKLESQGKDTNNVMLSITNILINAGVLSGVSSVYNQFLGAEDARLVKANPGPNFATVKTSGDERLKEAVEWTLKNYNKMEVTIPTFTEVVSVGETEKKQLRVVVGNFTHPSNITHGERTGACMRIGGVGETLFNFCLEDKNGFHIRFEDAHTGEYISRVSGFRNGNTVFLNELRHSCNSDLYNDKEIIEACKKISSTMIEMSKDSTCPIQNVVVARAYATDQLPEINLGISNNKKGLRAFYSDIQTSGIVLSSTGDPYMPIDFDKSKVPSYFPAREKAYVGNDTLKLMDMINRVHSVKEALSGRNYEYVEPISFDNEIVYGVVNQDWYICIDRMGNIYEEIIPIDKRAQEELEVARKMLASYIPEKVEEDTYQY